MQKQVMSLGRHIMEEQRKHPDASGNLSIIIEQIAFAAKIISREVNKAGLINIIGNADSTNVHGEDQQKLDVYANDMMIKALDHTGQVCAMASEENENVIEIPSKFPKGKYAIVFDPLDGSSNIDVNISIGTIFGIYKKKIDCNENSEENFFQPGRDLICAGYVIYGSSTMFVYSTGNGVNGFTLDPSVGEFLLSHPDMKVPECGKIYSINEANYDRWIPEIKNYVQYLKNYKERQYTTRYIGSLVADFHRNLLKGGVFLYTGDSKNPKGKLRLLYEGNPLAFIIEQAGGMATDGNTNILDIIPENLHQKTPLIIGSKFEVETYLKFLNHEL
jgi:fructose-1,6-bisphosphatase I